MKTDWQKVIVHCSATPPNLDIGRVEIDKWHRERGFACIGYHVVIRRSGALEIGRSLSKGGAHTHGQNRYSIGVCLIGGVDDKNKPDPNYSDAQLDTLRDLLAWINLPAYGHNDFTVKKACPCFNVPLWWKTGDLERKGG